MYVWITRTAAISEVVRTNDDCGNAEGNWSQLSASLATQPSRFPSGLSRGFSPSLSSELSKNFIGNMRLLASAGCHRKMLPDIPRASRLGWGRFRARQFLEGVAASRCVLALRIDHSPLLFETLRLCNKSFLALRQHIWHCCDRNHFRGSFPSPHRVATVASSPPARLRA